MTARLDGLPPHRINRLGLSRSFQITSIFHRLSVFENIRCSLLWSRGYRYSFWHALGRQRALNEETERLLEELNLAERRDVQAGLLSYAEQRALEIGMTIAGGASMILLDEPTAGMSHSETEYAVALIRRVTQGKTLVMVEHDMRVVFDLADTITVLVYGQRHRLRPAGGNPRQSRGAGSLSRGAGGMMLEVARSARVLWQEPHPARRQPVGRTKAKSSVCSGRNGVGRSTTCKAIMGLVEPVGTVRYRGRDIAGLRANLVARAGIGYVPEDRQIFPTLTVRQNLMLGLKRAGRFGRWNFDDVFRLFPNLAERQNNPAGVLSGGEQQMLTMCRTLMGDPDLILIDEPTEGLAPMLVEQVGHLLEEIARRGVAILLVEQKLTIAMRISQRLYVMGHGRIVFEGTPADIDANADVRREWLEV